jgi:hypothetical protein
VVGLRLRRCLGPVPHLAPAEYTVETASGDPAICCPACGEATDLDMKTHRVLPGGMVSPIWSCPLSSCAYQGFNTLESYGEPVVPA